MTLLKLDFKKMDDEKHKHNRSFIMTSIQGENIKISDVFQVVFAVTRAREGVKKHTNARI